MKLHAGPNERVVRGTRPFVRIHSIDVPPEGASLTLTGWEDGLGVTVEIVGAGNDKVIPLWWEEVDAFIHAAKILEEVRGELSDG
jgi:hypothetical protein